MLFSYEDFRNNQHKLMFQKIYCLWNQYPTKCSEFGLSLLNMDCRLKLRLSTVHSVLKFTQALKILHDRWPFASPALLNLLSARKGNYSRRQYDKEVRVPTVWIPMGISTSYLTQFKYPDLPCLPQAKTAISHQPNQEEK